MDILLVIVCLFGSMCEHAVIQSALEKATQGRWVVLEGLGYKKVRSWKVCLGRSRIHSRQISLLLGHRIVEDKRIVRGRHS
jgi:hypothetical protein